MKYNFVVVLLLLLISPVNHQKVQQRNIYAGYTTFDGWLTSEQFFSLFFKSFLRVKSMYFAMIRIRSIHQTKNSFQLSIFHSVSLLYYFLLTWIGIAQRNRNTHTVLIYNIQWYSLHLVLHPRYSFIWGGNNVSVTFCI